MAKVLVTGGAGFIGSNLVDRLIELGHEVIVIDNLSNGKKGSVNGGAELIIADTRDDLSWLFGKHKFDYVFHLAAQVNLRKSIENPGKDAEMNIIGSLNIIENCIRSKVKKIIFSSSGGAIYSPDAEIPCTENSKIEPQSPYGLAKWTIENYLRIFREIYGLDFACLRYSNVYGPRQDAKGEAGVVSIFIEGLLNGKEVRIFGDGEQTRDFVFVKDVVEANIAAMNLSGAFNVSSGVETSVNELLRRIREAMKVEGKVIHASAINGELRRNCLSTDKLKSFGWKARYSLDNGLKETFEWFKEEYGK